MNIYQEITNDHGHEKYCAASDNNAEYILPVQCHMTHIMIMLIDTTASRQRYGIAVTFNLTEYNNS